MKVIRRETKLEIEKSADVIVIGGGPAGLGAAVSAARQGQSVILLEKRAYLGGNITASYVENCNYYLRNTSFKTEGLYAEIEKKFFEKYENDNIRPRNKKSFNSEYLKVFLDELVVNEGINIYFHSFVNEVITEKDKIQAIVVQTKNGPMAMSASVYIDSTGDGDVAFNAGIPFELGRDEDGLCQPGTVNVRFAGADTDMIMSKTDDKNDRLTEIGHDYKKKYRAGETGLPCKRQDLPFGRLSKAGQISYTNYSCVYGIDPTKIEDLTRGEIEGRRYTLDILNYLKRSYEEFRNLEVASIAPEIGFRDSRRIKGEYRLTIEDMESKKHFDDVIAVFPRFYDMLAPDAYMDGDGKVEGKGYKGHIYEPVTDERTFEIPYRSLLPVGISNLLTSGRCISADHVAQSGVRAIYACMLIGEAAGIAASIANKNQKALKQIDVSELQKKLREQNITI